MVGAVTTVYFLMVRHTGVYALVYGQIVQLSLVTLATWPFLIISANAKPSWSVLREPLLWGYALLPGAYSDLVIQLGDRYFLATLANVSLVGLYDLGYRISSIISMLLINPAKRGLHPLILKKEANPDEQRKFIRISAEHFYMIGTFVAVAVSLFGRDLVVLLSSDERYHRAWIIIPIISFAYVQHGMGHFFNYGIVMAKRWGYDSMNLFVSAAVNVVLNILLIPSYGILGAAAATLVCYLVWNSLKLYFSSKFYQLRFNLSRLILITVAGAGTVAGGLYLSECCLNQGIPRLVAKAVFCFLFLAVLALPYIASLRGRSRMDTLWDSCRSAAKV
jgi:O-antigen/teichoic acid export membrane protein